MSISEKYLNIKRSCIKITKNYKDKDVTPYFRKLNKQIRDYSKLLEHDTEVQGIKKLDLLSYGFGNIVDSFQQVLLCVKSVMDPYAYKVVKYSVDMFITYLLDQTTSSIVKGCANSNKKSSRKTESR